MPPRLKLPVPFQLASVWTPTLSRDLSGWIWSEKLDGVRAMWDGRGSLLSRNGIAFKAPRSFTVRVPRGVILDGELWIDRGMFHDTVSVIRTRDVWTPLIRFQIIDAYSPQIRRYNYSDRVRWILDNSATFDDHVTLHPSFPLEDPDPSSVSSEMERIVEKGGEGLIIRDPTSMYSPGRKSPLLSSMLKVKPFLDDEAVVIAITLRDGRRGSVTVKDREGRIFKIASGFRDVKSELPPVEGSVISFAFTARNPDSGIPRFPRYIRVRSDSEFSH